MPDRGGWVAVKRVGLTLAGFAGSNLLIEVHGAVARDGERFPVLSLEVLGEENDLAHN